MGVSFLPVIPHSGGNPFMPIPPAAKPLGGVYELPPVQWTG